MTVVLFLSLFFLLLSPVFVRVSVLLENDRADVVVSQRLFFLVNIRWQRSFHPQQLLQWALERSGAEVADRLQELRALFQERWMRIATHRTLLGLGYMLITGQPPHREAPSHQIRRMAGHLLQNTLGKLRAFRLKTVVGRDDAASSATTYGILAACGGWLQGYLVHHSPVQNLEIVILPHFDGPRLLVDLDCIFRFIPGHIILVALGNLVQALFRKGASWLWTEIHSTPSKAS